MAESPVVWRSALQKEIVLSSTEAEYLALTEATREVNWLRNLLNEISIFTGTSYQSINIRVDNQSAIALARDHINSKRSRHINLRNHYCREQLAKGHITVEYIRTDEQLADGLTKAKTPNSIL